jgi:membrane-associated phospholipid phosphatase
LATAVRIRYMVLFGIFTLGSYFFIQDYVTHEYDFLTPIDKAFPFMPDFVWLYHSLMPAMVVTMILLVKSRRNFFTVFWAGLLATLLINLFYILLPSFYPRPDFIPATLSEHLLYETYQVDNSSNTFPSGHVAYAWLMFYGVIYSMKAKEFPVLGRLYLLWAIGITLSTLAIKAHYIIDVIGGFAVGAFCYYIVKSIIEKRNYYKERCKIEK